MKITFNDNFRCFSKDETIELNKPLNFLVGDNGTGKSTILTLIRSHLKDKLSDSTKWHKDYTDTTIATFTDFEYDLVVDYDISKDDPSTFGMASMDLFLEYGGVSAKGISSGQGQFQQFFRVFDLILNNPGKRILVLLDEIDRPLSVKYKNKILELINRISSKEQFVTFVISSHNENIGNYVDEVFNVELRQYVNFYEYSFNLFYEITEFIKYFNTLEDVELKQYLINSILKVTTLPQYLKWSTKTRLKYVENNEIFRFITNQVEKLKTIFVGQGDFKIK